MVICLGRGADLHMVQLIPLPLTVSCSSKSRLVLPFWYLLTHVIPDKGPLTGVVVVVVVVVETDFTVHSQTQTDTHTHKHTHIHTHNQFTALWIFSGTTRVSQHQKKHSPTHNYRGHQLSLICFIHLLWSMASSLFNLCVWQSFSTISLQVYFGLPLGLAR